MTVKEGDVLVCQCEDCNLELVVQQACSEDACGCEGCEIQVSCCDLPMVVKEKGGCCCGD
jgi:hypothetical protein